MRTIDDLVKDVVSLWTDHYRPRKLRVSKVLYKEIERMDSDREPRGVDYRSDGRGVVLCFKGVPIERAAVPDYEIVL